MIHQVKSDRKPFLEHLQELKQILFRSAIVVIAGSVVGYFLKDFILGILTKPLNEPLYYTSPGGGFDLNFKISLYFGILVAVPFIIYQVIKYLEPIISKMSRIVMALYLFSSTLLLIVGISFGYYFSLPSSLKFLASFSTDSIRPLISTGDYFSFVTIYLLGYGLLFQLPVIMLLINRIKPLKPRRLLSKWRWVIGLSFIIGGLFAPNPDVLSLMIVSLPPILLYTLSTLLILLINRNRNY